MELNSKQHVRQTSNPKPLQKAVGYQDWSTGAAKHVVKQYRLQVEHSQSQSNTAS